MHTLATFNMCRFRSLVSTLLEFDAVACHVMRMTVTVYLNVHGIDTLQITSLGSGTCSQYDTVL